MLLNSGDIFKVIKYTIFLYPEQVRRINYSSITAQGKASDIIHVVVGTVTFCYKLNQV